MNKPISRPLHGFLDYGYAAAITAAPEVLGFVDEAETATFACRILGIGTVLAAVFTRYELGVVRVMPFKMHLLGDLLTGISALVLPFALKFSDKGRARNTFLGFGVLALVVSFLTSSEEM